MFNNFPAPGQQEVVEHVLLAAHIAELAEWDNRAHVKRVRRYTYILARGTGLGHDEAALISTGAMLHDVHQRPPVPRLVGVRMHRRGFTLIELLVVMTIIAGLLTLAVPRYFQHLDRTHEAVLQSDLVNLVEGIAGVESVDNIQIFDEEAHVTVEQVRLSVDQLGTSRPSAGESDIGAIELR